jgi:hypothetical protein
MRTRAPIAGIALLVGAIGLHRVGRRSGVTELETHAALAGDDLVPDPMWQSTRGITIDAVPEAIWPWLAQMGFPAHRGGWYTPHLLDMLTFGIRQRSAEEIVEELQCVEVGDRIPDSADWSVFFTVARADPPHALVLHSTRHVLKPTRTIDFSWAFVVQDDHRSEQVVHSRPRPVFAALGVPLRRVRHRASRLCERRRDAPRHQAQSRVAAAGFSHWCSADPSRLTRSRTWVQCAAELESRCSGMGRLREDRSSIRQIRGWRVRALLLTSCVTSTRRGK